MLQARSIILHSHESIFVTLGLQLLDNSEFIIHPTQRKGRRRRMMLLSLIRYRSMNIEYYYYYRD